VGPARVEAFLEAWDRLQVGKGQKRRAAQLTLEKARYEADRIRRQYEAVEPENRLVAAELESRWNQALRRVEELEARLSVAAADERPLLILPRRSVDGDACFHREISTTAWLTDGLQAATPGRESSTGVLSPDFVHGFHDQRGSGLEGGARSVVELGLHVSYRHLSPYGRSCMRIARAFNAVVVVMSLTLVVAGCCSTGRPTGETANCSKPVATAPRPLRVALFPYVPDKKRMEAVLHERWRKVSNHPIEFVEFWDGYDSDPTDDLDVFEFDAISLEYFVRNGFVAPADPATVPAPGDISDFAWHAAHVDGVLYGVPRLACTFALFYRDGDTDLAQAGGLADLERVRAPEAGGGTPPEAGRGLLIGAEMGMSPITARAQRGRPGSRCHFHREISATARPTAGLQAATPGRKSSTGALSLRFRLFACFPFVSRRRLVLRTRSPASAAYRAAAASPPARQISLHRWRSWIYDDARACHCRVGSAYRRPGRGHPQLTEPRHPAHRAVARADCERGCAAGPAADGGRRG